MKVPHYYDHLANTTHKQSMFSRRQVMVRMAIGEWKFFAVGITATMWESAFWRCGENVGKYTHTSFFKSKKIAEHTNKLLDKYTIGTIKYA